MSRVKVHIEADKSGFDTALEGVSHSLEGLKEMVVGAFTVEAVSGIIEKTVEYAETIDKASLRMKLTTEQTQGLSIVAREAGSNLETIEDAFKKIEAARAKALGGSPEELNAFKKLGVNAAQLALPNNTIGLAGNLASAAGKGSTDTQGVALQQLGLKGVSGDLIALGDSLQHFDEKVNELKAKGAIIEDKDISNIVRAKDELAIVGDTLVAQVAPWLSQLIEGLEEGWIILQTTAENVFTAIILTAQHAIEFIKSMASSITDQYKFTAQGAWAGYKAGGIFGAVGGAIAGSSQATEKSGNPTDIIAKFASNIKNDIVTTATMNKYEIATKIDTYIHDLNEELKKRETARTNKPEDIARITPGKENKLYSDSLTSVGNMIGASFGGIKDVTTQMDVSKRQLNTLDKILDNNNKQTAFLEKMANVNVNYNNIDWTKTF